MKLLETATQNERTAAAMWWMSADLTSSAKTTRLTTYPLAPTRPNLNSWTQLAGSRVPRWTRRTTSQATAASSATAPRSSAAREAGPGASARARERTDILGLGRAPDREMVVDEAGDIGDRPLLAPP